MSYVLTTEYCEVAMSNDRHHIDMFDINVFQSFQKFWFSQLVTVQNYKRRVALNSR